VSASIWPSLARPTLHGLKVGGVSSIDFRGTPVTLHFNYDEITYRSGVVGDATEASAEKGKLIFESMVDGCAEFVQWYKDIPASF
jgi:creatinine amidohydrolase/Fe(II)-dependent formamide hydrolase-like protein